MRSLLDDLRFPLNREVLLRQAFYNLINAGFCVFEFDRDFMRERVRIILHDAGDFFQGSTYPVGGMSSLASGDHHFDNFFRSKKRL